MPTDWEANYQQNDTPWDKGGSSPGLVDFLTTEPIRGRVLVPGCGLGHDVRALATTADEVIGLDIAPSAIKTARTFPPVGGERYELADFFDLPPALRGSFDWLWEQTCFCAIDREMRLAYVEAAATALQPGGHLLAIFYLDPGHEDPNDGPPFGTSLPELDALFAPRFTVLREWLPQRAYPGREGREWLRLLVRH